MKLKILINEKLVEIRFCFKIYEFYLIINNVTHVLSKESIEN